MEIMNRILELLQQKNLSQTDICNYLGIKTNVFTTWKTRGTDPPTKYIIQICDFLNVTPEYLLTGTERCESTNISNSAVGAVGNYSKGTVTLGSTSESKSEDISKCVLSENEEELLRIFKSLPKRERVRLLNMVYEFEEDYRRKVK